MKAFKRTLVGLAVTAALGQSAGLKPKLVQDGLSGSGHREDLRSHRVREGGHVESRWCGHAGFDGLNPFDLRQCLEEFARGTFAGGKGIAEAVVAIEMGLGDFERIESGR